MASSAARITRHAAHASWLALAVASAVAIATPWTGPNSLLLGLFLLAPLALPLAGYARGDRRTYGWATLCVMPGFVYGITESVANPVARGAAGWVLAASLLAFFALVAHLRATRPQPPASG